MVWGWGPGPAVGPAGGTVLQSAAGTGPHWLSGLNRGRQSGPAQAAAAGPSVCRPPSRRCHARWKPGRNVNCDGSGGLACVQRWYVHEQLLHTGDQAVPRVAGQELQTGGPRGGQVEDEAGAGHAGCSHQ